MNVKLLPSLERLQQAFQMFPGVGPKSAIRMALHVLHLSEDSIHTLIEAVSSARSQLRFCVRCNAFAEGQELCKVCSDEHRETETVCLVEDPFVVLMLEQRYKKVQWVYHVSHGLISPLDRVYPEDLRLQNLFDRLQNIKEIIVAFSSSVEGEATATFLKEVIQKKAAHVSLSRIAHGIPFGTRLETVDQMTLEQALHHRQPM